MRQYLFRGYDPTTGEWVTDKSLRVAGKKAYIGKTEVDPESVGMFTGLLDGNGTKVFEGDIVRGEHRYGIVWYQPHGCFKLMRHGEVFECSEFAVKMKNVIGNLYNLKTEKERMYFYGKEE